jgi:eukaryotic-like serine/threonine-protein kinase
MSSAGGTLADVERCPEPWALEAFVQGNLAFDARGQMEAHLDRCSACTQTIAELARLFGSPALTEHRRLSSTLSLGTWTDATGGGASNAPLAPRPTEVGRYQLGRRLGAGAMGMVFEAQDPDLHRRVAVKLLHPGASDDAERTRNRLLLEAQAMARLAHPNVVAVHDVGRAGDQVFLAIASRAGLD